MVAVHTLSWEEAMSPGFGNPARQAWRQAVAQVEEQLRAKLRVEVLPERQRKALDLVRADAVTLHADGTARRASARHGCWPAASASSAKPSATAAVTLRGPVVRCLPGAPQQALSQRLEKTAAPARRTAAASAA